MSLKAIFRSKGVRQRRVAQALNVSDSVVSRWAGGTLDVPSYYVLPLAELLNVPAAEVLLHGVRARSDGTASLTVVA